MIMPILSLGTINQAATVARNKGDLAMFSSLVRTARDRVAKRRRYNQLVDEIMSMSQRDLADINGNRTDMLAEAHREVYGR